MFAAISRMRVPPLIGSMLMSGEFSASGAEDSGAQAERAAKAEKASANRTDRPEAGAGCVEDMA
jgi:hypothetical protein